MELRIKRGIHIEGLSNLVRAVSGILGLEFCFTGLLAFWNSAGEPLKRRTRKGNP